MDQVEQQEEYHTKNMEGNDSLKNQVENLTDKFQGMNEKLNTLTRGKRKYESESFDSRRKKKTSTYADRQNLSQQSSSRNHDQVSKNTSADTSVAKSYGVSDEEGENEDDTISIPDVVALSCSPPPSFFYWCRISYWLIII